MNTNIDIDAEIAALNERKAKLKKLAALRAEVALLEREQSLEFDDMVKQVLTCVADHRKVGKDILLSPNRQQWVSDSRFIAIVLIHKYTPMTQAAIGRLFNRDHGTIIHALRAADKLVSTNAAFRRDMETVESEVFKQMGAPRR